MQCNTMAPTRTRHSLQLVHDEFTGSADIEVAKDCIELVTAAHINVIDVQRLQGGRLESLAQIAECQCWSQLVHRFDYALLWTR